MNLFVMLITNCTSKISLQKKRKESDQRKPFFKKLIWFYLLWWLQDLDRKYFIRTPERCFVLGSINYTRFINDDYILIKLNRLDLIDWYYLIIYLILINETPHNITDSKIVALSWWNDIYSIHSWVYGKRKVIHWLWYTDKKHSYSI